MFTRGAHAGSLVPDDCAEWQSIPDTSRLSCARWTRRLTAAGIAVAVAASTNLAAASAESDTAASVDPAVASYASDYSVTVQEAQRRLNRIQPIQEILASTRDLEVDRLAGWGIDHSGTFNGWVWLTGNQPPTAGAASIASAHADVEIRTGATHSYAALLAAQDGLGAVGPTGRVNDGSGSDVWSIVTFTDVDMRANGIEIGIDPALGMSVPGGLTDTVEPSVTDAALQAKATEVAGILRDRIPVRFAVVDGVGPAAEEFAGGEQIGLCTAGFAAQETGGRRRYGIITAGHCGADGPNENETFTMHGVTLPFVYGWASVTADAQFHEIPTGSSHVLHDDYICNYSRNVRCDVSGTKARRDMGKRYKNRFVGDYVCHAGRKTHVTCGNVTSINYQPNYDNACLDASGNETRCYNVFVKVSGSTLESCGGDSGGPWYRSGVAYGIHMGHSPSKDNCNDPSVSFAFFSAIREVESFLGVEILTDGSVTVN